MPIADDLPLQLAPWLTDDLGDYAAVLGGMFAEVESYCEDEDGGPAAWSAAINPDLIPAKGLPYLAQWIGERLPTGISEPEARQWIKDAPNQRRGTLEAIARAAERKLTPGTSQTVSIRERHKLDGTADIDMIAILTFADETPSTGAVLAEMRSVAPWDVVIDYGTSTITTWSIVVAAYANWGAMKAAMATWGSVTVARVGYVTWSR
jgi:hypothetical protein